MTQYLLAAEADKIQDLIFRASKLREVVGGSQLLSRFEDNKNSRSALCLLKAKTAPTAEVVSAGGGSFRILFDSEAQAQEFGKNLAEIYRLTTGGTLSVARPVPYNGDYQVSAEEANTALRRAKISGGQGQTTAHQPYTAFCASCGVALAKKIDKQNKKFLCSVCLAKGNERKSEQTDRFLAPFYEMVVDNYESYDWPGKQVDRDPSGELAKFDSRNYVAYLVADGNNMGKLFGQCNKEQAKELSHQLTSLLQQCLAQPTKLLIEQSELKAKNFVPVLPLILGGDDLFALLPAKWALDFAGRFCRAYDEAMLQTLKEQKLSIEPPPTMAAAVVICKANYPYYLAHRAGLDRLKEAKRQAKLVAMEKEGVHSSVVNFEIITGSQLVQTDNEDDQEAVRDTLRPYWLNPGVPNEWGLSLDILLGQRAKLVNLPRRRRAQLRYYFDELRGLKDEDAEKRKIEQILQRIARNKDDIKNIEAVLQALGNSQSGWLREVETNTDSWLAHGLPDLLDAWDFTQKVDAVDPGEEDN